MKKCFLTEKGPKAVGPYSTCVIDGDVAYLSGMIPLDPAVNKLVEGGIEAQAHQVFKNISTVLGELGIDMTHTLKTTVLLTDLANFAAVNVIYAEYFGPEFPARSCFQVSALPVGAMIEVEIIATMKK